MATIAEAREMYTKACRAGWREHDSRTARGLNGHLAHLDEYREHCGIIAEVRQPTKEIPLSRIVGTNSATRATSFAANFMPLYAAESEFGQKWVRLCMAHLDEGLRDPIKVYEYLWNYYVIEGNKRVSVLKFFDAYSFHAEIIRLIPQRDDNNPEIVQYYEYLAYSKKGLFPDIMLTQEKGYRRLRGLERRLQAELPAGVKPDYSGMYRDFERAYDTVTSPLPLGDAFVEYLHVFGFPMDETQEELRQRIGQLQPQLELVEQAPETEVVLEAGENPQQSLLSRLLPWKKEPHIVFAYMAGRAPGNWIQAHEDARLQMQEELGDQVTSSYVDGLTVYNAYDRLNLAAKQGADMIFVTDSAFMDAALRVSLEHPRCLLMVYSPVQHTHRLHTYFGRYYEPVFLCGALAAYASRSQRIAYITPGLSLRRFTSDINSFAIGARMVNPSIEVNLAQVSRPGDLQSHQDASRRLAEQGVDVVLAQRILDPGLAEKPHNAFSFLGRVNADGVPVQYLAAPRWNWSHFYTYMVRSYLNGSLEALTNLYNRGEATLTNFWWGMCSGVVDINIGDWVPYPAGNLIQYLVGSMRRNHFNPFQGPLMDQSGKERIHPQDELDPLQILAMDWLVDFIRVQTDPQ